MKEKPDFVQRIVTPLIRATHKRTGDQQLFFSMQEFDAWSERAEVDLASWSLKYYKGLGTSSSKEARAVFRDLPTFTVSLVVDPEAPETLSRFYDEGRAEERKRLLTSDYDKTLSVDYAKSQCSVTDFMLCEHIHFSHYSVFRALPSGLDGLTPSRRKALFYFLQQRGTSGEEKVAQAASGVARKTLYLHGEASLVETIVGLAQDYVGTNNVALLQPLGQFGSRNDKPSTHAASRYIFTRLDPVARALFPEADDPVLAYRTEEGQQIEPVHYVPVIPVLALNGAQGIGTGFSTCVPSHSFEDLCLCARQLAEGAEDMSPVRPQFRGFRGSVLQLPRGVQTTGVLTRQGPRQVVITELPVGRWTDPFLAELKACAEGSKQIRGLSIVAVVNMSTEFSVHIELTLGEENESSSDEELSRLLRLSQCISTTHMYAFDGDYQLRLYDDAHSIVKEHARERLLLYAKRKQHQLQEMERKLILLQARARFIALVTSGVLELRGAPRGQLVEQLRAHALPSLPTRGDAEGFEYLLSTSVSAFTGERIEALTKEAERLAADLERLRATEPRDMWLEEIGLLEQAFVEYTSRLERRHSEDGDAKKSRSAGANRSTPAAKRRSVPASSSQGGAGAKKRPKKT